MTTRYRLSDKGILLAYNEIERKFVPVDCGEFQHYCGKICKRFTTTGDTAVLKCQKPEIHIDLED